MHLPHLLILLATLAATPALAVEWTIVGFKSTSFTSLSGTMTIPDLPTSGDLSEGTYVWPALQGDNGVFQAVCDGRTGSWWIGDGFYGTPSLSWGAGFSTTPGSTVDFTFTVSPTNSSLWTATLSQSSTSASVSTSFNLDNDVLNEALFAVELYGTTYDFGPTTYTDVKMESTQEASGWCVEADVYSWGYYADGSYTYGNSDGLYTLEGLVADGYGCSFDKLVMPNRTVF